MIYVYLFFSCVVFIELFISLDLKKEAFGIVTRSREAMNVAMSSELDDDAKEKVQEAAEKRGQTAFHFFEFVKIGVPLACVNLLVYWIFL